MVLLLACVNMSTLQLADPVDVGEVQVLTGAGLRLELPPEEQPPEDAQVRAGNAAGTFALGDFVVRTGLTDRSDAGFRMSVVSFGLGAGAKFALVESERFDLSVGPQWMTYWRPSSRPFLGMWTMELPLLIGVQPTPRFTLDVGVATIYMRNRFDGESGWHRRVHAIPLLVVDMDAADRLGLWWDRSWLPDDPKHYDSFGVLVGLRF